jgi:hypothetical protein
MKLTSGNQNSAGLPSRIWNWGLDRRADQLLRGNAIHLLGPWANKLDAATRNDEGLETIRAQIGKQFEHRLVNQLGIVPLESWITRCGKPIRHHFRELIGRHAGVRKHYQFSRAALAGFRHSPYVSVQDRLERIRIVPFRMQGSERLDAIEGEGHLGVHRLFGPKRAIVIERRDAIGWRDKIRSTGFGDPVDKIDDRLLRRRVVP